MKLVTWPEMQEIERRAQEDAKYPVSIRELMLNAGQCVYEAINGLPRFLTNPEDGTSELDEATIVVLAGPGNNGGDAMVTAALLHQRYPEANLKTYFYKRPRPDDDDGFPEKLTYTYAEEQDGVLLDTEPAFEALEDDLEDATLIVDGLLGSGVNRVVTGALDRLIDMVNETRQERMFTANPPVIVSIDVPSGLNSDTGEVMGAAIEATLTVTLGYPKIGLYSYAASDYTGQITIGDIGIPVTLQTQVEMEARQKRQPALISAEWVRRNLPQRPHTGHKGTFGKLLILSGAATYLGAPYLCTAAGMRSGAGVVTLAAPQNVIQVVATKLHENTFLPLPEITDETAAAQVAGKLAEQLVSGRYRCFLLGPGLGQSEPKAALLRNILDWKVEWPRVVVDADGLNLLAQIPEWWQKLPANSILTPHPGELATLRGQTIEQIEQDRIKSASSAAKLFNQVVVLKGAYTVVAAPDGRVKLNPASNAALATAGSGDVLAGIAAGLFSQVAREQQADAFDVACLAVYLHAMAGELVRRELGDMGALAGDLLPAIPRAVLAVKGGDKIE